MSLSSYVSLGCSDLRVSPFAVGAMTFGEERAWGAKACTSRAILARYLELGGNFIDATNGYTFGHSEKVIGDLIGGNCDLRNSLVIATKFGSNMYPGDFNGGAGSKAITRACEQSLRRLRTDYIDLYWMQVPDKFTPLEGTMRTLEQLVSSGKVRYIGFLDTPAWKIAQAQLIASLRGWSPLVAVQTKYSLLDRSVETDLIPMARELGLGVVPWSPLSLGVVPWSPLVDGILSGKYTRASAGSVDGARTRILGVPVGEREFAIIDVLSEIAERHETMMAAIALAWLRSRAGVSSTILGARTLAHLEAKLDALDVRLKADEIARLDDLSTPPMPFITRITEGADMDTQHGTTVNRHTQRAWQGAPAADVDCY